LDGSRYLLRAPHTGGCRWFRQSLGADIPETRQPGLGTNG